jgi:hypothetical protein
MKSDLLRIRLRRPYGVLTINRRIVLSNSDYIAIRTLTPNNSCRPKQSNPEAYSV